MDSAGHQAWKFREKQNIENLAWKMSYKFTTVTVVKNFKKNCIYIKTYGRMNKKTAKK